MSGEDAATFITFGVVLAVWLFVVIVWCKSDSPIMTKTKTTVYRGGSDDGR